MLNELLTTAALVALMEIGDKTQLALLALSMRTRQPWKVFYGMIGAYLIIGALAVFLGKFVGDVISPETVKLVSAATFILLGIWSFLSKEDASSKTKTGNPLIASFAVVLFAELGDKTQIAATALAAKYDAIWPVFIGYLAGIYLVEAVTIFGGNKLADKIHFDIVKKVSSGLFILFGLLALVA